MTEEELHKRFHDLAEELFQAAHGLLEYPQYPRILNMDPNTAYRMFRTIGPNYPDSVDGRTELFQSLMYAIRDDGDMSLVHSCILNHRPDIPGINWKSPIYPSNEMFVMWGDPYEITQEKIFKIASENLPTGKRWLSMFAACHLDMKILDAILDYSDECRRIKVLDDNGRINDCMYNPYRKSTDLLLLEYHAEQKLIKHISSRQNHVTQTFPSPL